MSVMIKDELIQKLNDRSAVVAILGLGYVGLPLAVVFAEAGFKVIGIDPVAEKVDMINRGESYILDVPTETGGRAWSRPANCSATTDFAVLHPGGCGLHLRAHPAAQDRRPRSVLYRLRHRRAGAVRPPRHGGGARIEHLPRHHPRAGAAAPGRSQRPESRARISSWPSRRNGSTPAARTGPPSTPPRWWAASPPACAEVAAAWYGQALQDGGAGLLGRSGRDGQAAGKHLPHDQHRPGQRTGDHVRPAGRGRVGSDRRRRHQALRLHEIHPRARPGRALHPDRPALPLLEDASRSTTTPASSNWPPRSTPTCRASWSARCRMRSTTAASRSRAAACWCWAWPTSRISTTCANRRRWT